MAALIRKPVPVATVSGQILMSVDGLNFTAQLPLTGEFWLTNANGILLVVG